MTEACKTVSTERGLLTEINGIMFDQLSVEQLPIWARTIIFRKSEFVNREDDITLSRLVDYMTQVLPK